MGQNFFKYGKHISLESTEEGIKWILPIDEYFIKVGYCLLKYIKNFYFHQQISFLDVQYYPQYLSKLAMLVKC